MGRRRLLIVEDEAKMCRLLELNLRDHFDIVTAEDGQKALKFLQDQSFDVVLSDIRMPGVDGMGVLREVRRCHPEVPVVLITAYGTIENAVQAMKEGAFDYLVKPLKMAEVTVVLQKALHYRDLLAENRQLRERLREREPQLITVNPQMQRILELVEQVAPTDATVLIEGESGTGKEVIARIIHQKSQRASQPFVAINCAAIPRDLLESELFGHQKGAFTGAVADKKGRFELAHRGTIFLDEIGEMPLDLQVKILRVLEEQKFMRVGGVQWVDVDVRFIAASNRRLDEAVSKGQFREDLYYRLNVINIHLPPLRERPEDIPLLVNHFIQHYSQKLGKNLEGIESEALRKLCEYPWPGNVRELENAIYRAAVVAQGAILQLADLPDEVRLPSPTDETLIPKNKEELKKAKRLAKAKVVGEIEKRFLIHALSRNDWNISQTARDVRMDRRQLQNMIKRYGIKRPGTPSPHMR